LSAGCKETGGIGIRKNFKYVVYAHFMNTNVDFFEGGGVKFVSVSLVKLFQPLIAM
jgi:hypothetical protein